MAYEIFDQPAAWQGIGAEEGMGFSEAPDPDTEGEEKIFNELFAPRMVSRVSPFEDIKLTPAPEEDDEYPDMETSYVMFKEEPGFDQMYQQAGDWLERPGGMLEQFNIFPVNIT